MKEDNKLSNALQMYGEIILAHKKEIDDLVSFSEASSVAMKALTDKCIAHDQLIDALQKICADTTELLKLMDQRLDTLESQIKETRRRYVN